LVLCPQEVFEKQLIVPILIHSIFKNSKTLNALLIRSIIYNGIDMITRFSFPCILIILPKLHNKNLLIVNEVNSITKKRNIKVEIYTNTCNSLSVLVERKPLSFKTTFSPHIISKHILKIHF